MAERFLPRYPVYVPSKGRADRCLTARFLAADGVPFRLVVEPQEADEYRARFGDAVVELPFSNLGLVPTRNWIWEHALGLGAERHWQLDDNIRRTWRLWGGERVPCESGPALRAVEDFTGRYENIAISGLAYKFFVVRETPPIRANVHVYSCSLIRNDLPYRFRGVYNDDTDLCLQVLTDGWCTALVNAFMVEKLQTMSTPGGNTDIYRGDGRLRMARELERRWPGIVTTKWRYGRPQHVIRNDWREFTTPFRRKPGVEVPTEPNEYGLTLRALREVEHPRLRQLLDKYAETTGRASVGDVREDA